MTKNMNNAFGGWEENSTMVLNKLVIKEGG